MISKVSDNVFLHSQHILTSIVFRLLIRLGSLICQVRIYLYRNGLNVIVLIYIVIISLSIDI